MVGKHHDLGSAKHGTEHWWHQRVTAIALVLLLIYLTSAFITQVIFGNGFADAVDFLSSPFSATFLILFLIAAFYHAVLGLQVIIEDYVHCESFKLVSIMAVKFAGFGLCILGILSTVKILFWSLLANGSPSQ